MHAIFNKKPVPYNFNDYDLPAKKLARILSKKEDHYPLSDDFEIRNFSGSGEVWYDSQKEHVVAWLKELDGPGAYKRKTRGLASRHFWNHFQCAPGLLWVAEALGVEKEKIQLACDAVVVGSRDASQCAAVRQVIPWSCIAEIIYRDECCL